MNQLEALQKLYIQTRTVTLPKNPKEGEEVISLEMEELGMDEMAKLGQSFDLDDQSESTIMMKTILAKSLKVDIKDLDKVSMANMADLMSYLTEMNNMGNEDKSKTDKIAEFMAQKQKIKKIDSSEIKSVE